MWSRKELKEKAKERFHQGYWKAVLAGIVLSIAVGSTNIPTINEKIKAPIKNIQSMEEAVPEGKFDDEQFEDATSFYSIDSVKNMIFHTALFVLPHKGAPLQSASGFRGGGMESNMKEYVEENYLTETGNPLLALSMTMIGIIMLGGAAIGITCKVLLLNPLEIGGRNYFTKSLREDTKLNELGSGFQKYYWNGVKSLFLRDLFIFLWSLLFVVPGIIKSYEYRMVPYLLAAHPEMSSEEAFKRSKEAMMGNKWDAFVLDLSFLGWYLLSALTCGILSVFYVNPYVYQTEAALYEVLCEKSAVEVVEE